MARNRTPAQNEKAKKKTGTEAGGKSAAKKTPPKHTPADIKKEQKKGGGKISFAAPRGMHDVLPADAPAWERLVSTAKDVAEFYGFTPIETPILEKKDLFVRSIGETTDIVEKEMYVLRTKGGDRLALRPEGTAPVVRSFLQHGMHKLPQPQKLYYIGPFFRHERPQAGRYRQFHQVGLEVVGGDSDPIYDAQVINAFFRMIEDMKVKSLIIHINSIGCRICRPGYRTKLTSYYKDKEMCRDCARRVKENPLRVLDCKKEMCQALRAEAPSILDSLCSPCRTHLKQTLEYLEEVKLPYMLDPFLVRGLDYYNRTVFEIFAEESEDALASGGRYDYLAEMIGGRSTSAAGAAMGIERVVEIVKETQPNSLKVKPKEKVFLVHIGDLAKRKSLPLMEDLRKNNISVFVALGKTSLSNQLEIANRRGTLLALILGQKEVYEESVIIRNMETGVQESVPVAKVADEIKKKLRS